MKVLQYRGAAVDDLRKKYEEIEELGLVVCDRQIKPH